MERWVLTYEAPQEYDEQIRGCLLSNGFESFTGEKNCVFVLKTESGTDLILIYKAIVELKKLDINKTISQLHVFKATSSFNNMMGLLRD